jgi:hypothetical protein
MSEIPTKSTTNSPQTRKKGFSGAITTARIAEFASAKPENSRTAAGIQID